MVEDVALRALEKGFVTEASGRFGKIFAEGVDLAEEVHVRIDLHPRTEVVFSAAQRLPEPLLCLSEVQATSLSRSRRVRLPAGGRGRPTRSGSARVRSAS